MPCCLFVLNCKKLKKNYITVPRQNPVISYTHHQQHPGCPIPSSTRTHLRIYIYVPGVRLSWTRARLTQRRGCRFSRHASARPHFIKPRPAPENKYLHPLRCTLFPRFLSAADTAVRIRITTIEKFSRKDIQK